jgi:peptidoglycan hydrolase-like protein with peptidoglycan-binding domain
MRRHIAHNPRYVKSGISKVALAALLGFGGAAFTGISPAPMVHAESATSVTGLKVGANGAAVTQLQQALIDAGFAVPGGADGVFGAGTESAVKQFQTAQGLNASGTVTTATAIALGLLDSPYIGLASGASGDAVRQLQQRLIDRGINVPGGADGVFGPGTTAAVKEFQKQLGYYPSGTVNAATAAALGQTSSGSSGGGGGGITPAAPATADEQGDRGAGAPAAAPGGGALVGLALGQRGDAVKQLQQLLGGAGVEVVGGPDGIFGVLTQAALKSFQSAKGLDASGVVDQATVDALNSAQGGQTGDTPEGFSNNGGAAGPLVGLAFGATGEGVQRVQTALLQAGYTVRGGADGVFGNATQSALKAFQTSNGIEATGKVDERTAQALLTVLGDTPDPATANGALVGLQAGSTGGDVKALQELLIGLGIEVRGGADGIFGPATAQAVKNFQTSQGLAATGKVDDATAAALANPKPIGNQPAGNSTDGYAEYGERGERVLALQAALVKAGIALAGGVDGDFGASTTLAVREFQAREGLPVTGKVDAATAAKLGLGAAPAPIVTPPSAVSIDHFPVAPPCGFADTWRYDRGGGRVHLGVDIIAPTGTEVYAVVTGKVSKVYVDAPGSLSGNGVRIALPDGTYFFYAHLTSLAPGIELGVPVTAGQLIGTVGSTGNSATPHLHLEVHPQGGSAINPYPIVKAIDGC